MNDTIKNILRGLMSVCVVIPRAPDKSVYNIKSGSVVDMQNMRKDIASVVGEVNRSTEKAKEIFYVR
jgi:hypothetical protein